MRLKLYILIPMLFVVFSISAQNTAKVEIDYPENVTAELTKKEKSFIKDVYKSKAKAVVFDDNQFLKDIKHLLRNRVIIYEDANPKTQKKCKLLSEIELFDTYNKNLKREESFNPSNFNPLKYKLDFFAKGTYVYRVDNTNYFIQITSQYRRLTKSPK